MSTTNLTSTIPVILGHHVTPPLHEALSGIFGSISLACWLFILLPQLLENYRNQSAEAMSLPFIMIWLLGDIFNIVGGIWADLVPLVLAIGAYFCITDGVLIGQVLYYGIRNRRREGRSLLDATKRTMSQTEEDRQGVVGDREEEPLLKRTRSISITIPGSQGPSLASRRRSTDASALRRTSSGAAAADEHLAQIMEESNSKSGSRSWLKNLISVLAVCAIGTVGWVLAYESGAWTWKTVEHGPSGESQEIAKGAQVLGYASAALYLCARIPQIWKNYNEKSCEGLSLLFFIFSIMGNLTYGLGILCHSTEREYVIKNVPWLLGSLGTMSEDVIVFTQFHLYKDASEDSDMSAVV